MKRLEQLLFMWSRTFALLREACPALTVAVTILTLLEGVISIGVLYMVKLLTDAISQNLNSPEAGAGPVFMLLATTAAVLVCAVLVQSIGNMLRLRQGLAVSEFVDREIHDRAISVDLQFYESPHYYDALERARHGGSERPAQIVSNVVVTLRAAIVLAGVVLLLAGIDLLLIPILLLPVVIALSVRLYYTRTLFDWRMARSQLERRTNYLDWLLTSVTYAKELRLNRTGAVFRDRYRDLRTQIRAGHIQIEQARLWTEFAVAVLGAVVFVLSSAWLLQQTLGQQRPIGDVVLFILLLRRAESGGSELVSNASKIVDDHLYLKRLFDFLALRPKIEAPVSPRPISPEGSDSIRLSNVSFTYDGAQDAALHDVSMRIDRGQIVALVGENGSGKTTLIKLLTRLYDPSAGSITLNDTDIRQFDVDEYRGLFSVIFQDYVMYAETAGENIRLGDANRPQDRAAISQAARNAGASSFIEKLPQSYETPLTKLFDNGQDLSIGQWQRLALARAFYPRSRFVILDEPTSAVDPKAEFELFEDFRKRIGGRGALVISHRLSTVRLADYTYVLKDGRIAEHGAHDDLIAKQGRYAELFDMQARHYR